MKITIIALALVAYGAIADITYTYTRQHGFERGCAAGTAAVWPLFWIFMVGGEQ
ncbi:MAG: hypothetical protein J0I79_16605 [Mesorhizobium sp.]|uniref:hypothetical protein n=1 Tax=Mesorhizobium sp. TaxID=1871066 RepID=UPI001AC5C86B|nr:hypothetical protein [Mesorhizobium sp.]MBN9219568.1 hypothetical protein [Mesorhizobium sp.]